MMVIQEEGTHKILRLANELLSKQSLSMSLMMHIILVSIFTEHFMMIFHEHPDKKISLPCSIISLDILF